MAAFDQPLSPPRRRGRIIRNSLGSGGPSRFGLRFGGANGDHDMPNLTTTWNCDSCGELIRHADHGWVEWIDVWAPDMSSRNGRDIRIVHCLGQGPSAAGCQFDARRASEKDRGRVGDGALVEFQGPDGLMRLFEMIAVQRLPTSELLEIIKRIHIPRYEHARRHFKRALDADVIQKDVEPGFWGQDALRRVLAFARKSE
jgi:hypothetical protein